MKVTLRVLLSAVLGIGAVQAQKITAPSTGKTGTTSTSSTSSTGTTPTPITPAPIPTTTTPTQTAPVQPTQSPRPVFISGVVVIDDGSPLPVNVDIQSTCGAATQRKVAHAAGNGAFFFQWNDTASIFQDASDDSRFSSQSSSQGGFGRDPTANCELRASVSGYTSSRVILGDNTMSSNIDVGTIVLHRLTGDEGRTVSLTALKAPKNAAKNFEKGTAEVRDHKLPSAAASFQKALAIYPGYADALLSLGKIEFETGAKDAARAHFQQAMELDSKMSGPWEELGYMASDDSKWADAAKFLDQATRLDPTGAPKAWYFDGVANYNLGRFDVAERSIRAEIQLDGDRNPRAQFLLGLVLIAKKDLAGGADVLRKYIEKWPQASDAETARQQLSRVGSQIGMSGQR